MTKKLDKKIEKLVKSISKLTKKRKNKKRKVKPSKKNIAAEFAQQQLLTQLRNDRTPVPSSGGGSSGALTAQDAKRKVEEIQEEARRGDKDKIKKKLEALEHKTDANDRTLTNLQNTALQYQQEMSKQKNAPRGGMWTVDEEDEPEVKQINNDIKKLENKGQEINEQIHEDNGIDDKNELLAKQEANEHELARKKTEKTRKMVETKARKREEKEAVIRKAVEKANEEKRYNEELKHFAMIAARDKALYESLKLEQATAEHYKNQEAESVKDKATRFIDSDDDDYVVPSKSEPIAVATKHEPVAVAEVKVKKSSKTRKL